MVCSVMMERASRPSPASIRAASPSSSPRLRASLSRPSVDGRDKPGHDELERCVRPIAPCARARKRGPGGEGIAWHDST
jgi:hypothetical protein